MSKEKFIIAVDKCIGGNAELFDNEALEYYLALKGGKLDNGVKDKPLCTEKGKEILIFLQKNYEDYNNIFSSKQIGEGMGKTGRSISASIRGLATNGFVEKIGDNPVVYSLTEKGKNFNVDEE